MGIAIELVWVWIILVARFVRAIDRLGGDGFVQRNIWALVEGFEEEITDRVLQRIVARVQADMDRANFSHGVAEAFVKNKSAVLQRVRAATPHDGIVPSLAHIVGLDAALERAEERTYDAVVQIIDSEEVDRAVRDVVNSCFHRMTSELGEKSWKHKHRDSASPNKRIASLPSIKSGSTRLFNDKAQKKRKNKSHFARYRQIVMVLAKYRLEEVLKLCRPT